jgi:axial budding pattern protein 2
VKVWKTEPNSNVDSDDGVAKGGIGDELRMGIHYMRSLGEDQHVIGVDSSSQHASNVRSSFSSLDSSHQGHNDATARRTLVRIGENFRFRVPIRPALPSSLQTHEFQVRLTSGKPLPKFLHVDVDEIVAIGAIELYGTPTAADIGEVVLGLYSNDGVCVTEVHLEVVRWR